MGILVLHISMHLFFEFNFILILILFISNSSLISYHVNLNIIF